MTKHHGDFYCLNSFHFCATKKKLESHKKVCENKDLYNVNMVFDNTKILEFHQYQKSDKAPFIIYADSECIIEKIDGRKSNLESSSTKKAREHIPSSFQCLQYLRLEAYKIRMVYIEVKIV